MSFVSYAQNFEDAMLWRALRDIERGFYIDVGAQSPDFDSVTRAFSERGWRGINIEPHPNFYLRLVQRRPSDINLKIAIGEGAGHLTMNFIGDTGLSTADGEIARRHALSGREVVSASVEVKTLASIWRENVPVGEAVHFLKVDVEGFEREVLTGNDWRMFRPWIVVVEAMQPSLQIESHELWESILFDASYLFAYADGLNRFYVATEHANRLAALRYPPNVFDGIVTASFADLTKRVAELNSALHTKGQEHASEVAGWNARWIELAGALGEAQSRVDRLERGLSMAQDRERGVRSAAQRDLLRLERGMKAVEGALQTAEQRAEAAERALGALQSSVAWRAAAPLRALIKHAPLRGRMLTRRLLKAMWWAVTPWRMPARIRFIRARSNEPASKFDPISFASNDPLDLFSDADLMRAAGVPLNELNHVQSALTINDTWSAARWCLDFLRSRSDIRARFPRALSQGSDGLFATWLLSDESEADHGLSDNARAFVVAALGSDIARRPRQLFLHSSDVRDALPHGLTPTGYRPLFKWFMRDGRRLVQLRLVEVLWLFMAASEDPSKELVCAFEFGPTWQQRFPDGLTVFGRDRFARWFGETYGAEGEWLNPIHWPIDLSPASQLRLAYLARPAWQAAHPLALKDRISARRFLDALRNAEMRLDSGQLDWCDKLDKERMAAALCAPGINVIGHFSQPCGLQVSVCALSEGLERNGVQTSLRDIRADFSDEPIHERFSGFEEYGITLIHTQPVPFFSEAYRRCDLYDRSPRPYRIAYWYWEFDTIPQAWGEKLGGVDEVWTATEFVAKGLRDQLSVPVRTLFPGVRLGKFTRRSRAAFGLQENRFLFLFSFHMNSMMERKNPLGLIAAFKTAFRKDEAVTLVIKTMFAERFPDRLQSLRDAAEDWPIKIINATYSEDEVLSLMDVCDSYVSLHRSEGLGLAMAEAMLLEKPVIATRYSGNLSFMDDENSLLVDCELVQLETAMPPYERGATWAEPSIEHAALMMRKVFDNPVEAKALGARAKRFAEARLSLDVSGQAVARRLAEIREGQAGGEVAKSAACDAIRPSLQQLPQL